MIPSTLTVSGVAKHTGLSRWEIYRLANENPQFQHCVLYRTKGLTRFSTQRLIDAGYIVTRPIPAAPDLHAADRVTFAG